MVAMLSASSLGPYIPDMLMHPSATSDTTGPAAPSCLVLICPLDIIIIQNIRPLAETLRAVPCNQPGAHRVPVCIQKKPRRQQNVQKCEYAAQDQRRSWHRSSMDDGSHPLEYIGRRKHARYLLHPDGQCGERIKDSGEGRDQSRNRPHEPFRGWAQT